MKWTTDKPSTEGWYWWRYDKTGPADIHYLSHDGNGLTELDCMGKRHSLVDDGEWAGPLEPPQ